MARYCNDWKPDDGPSRWRKPMYSEGVSVSSTDHCSVNWRSTCLLRASTFWHCHTWSAWRKARAACNSCISSFSHSSETWCWTMNSISSWCGGSDTGNCADSSRSSCR